MLYRDWINRFNLDTSMFVLIVVSVVALVLETTLARLYVFLYPGPQSLQLNILLFTVGIIIFLFCHFLILVNIRKRLRGLLGDTSHKLKIIFRFVTINQLILSGLLLFVLFQILVNFSYKNSTIMVIVSISYLSGIINLSILAERFARWMLRNRSYISVLFGLSTFSILLNIIFSVILVVSVLSTQPNNIGQHVGILSATFSDYSTIIQLQQVYSVSFIISYVVTWLATVTVLQSHSKRLGRAKFWVLVILPLLYIVGEFQPVILPLLSNYRYDDPVTFIITYTLIFSIIKIAGAIFFGIGFWFMARKIEQRSLKSFLNISAYGLVLVFVTNQAMSLT